MSLPPKKRNSHTAAQREFIIQRLAYGYTVISICAKFKARWPDTECADVDVHSCDPSIFLLGPEEHTIFARAHDYALANPETLAPAMNPTRRQLNIAHMAEDARERNALTIAAELYEQLAKEQADAYAPRPPGKGKPEAPAAEQIDEIRVTYIRPPAPVAT